MDNPASEWLLLARGLCRKVNWACWLDGAAVPVVSAAGVSASGILWMRYAMPAVGGPWMAIWFALPVIAALWAWWRVRERFIGVEEAMVRLEVWHGLHAALSAASAGAGDWPPVRGMKKGDGLRWRWTRASVPPLLAIGLLVAAWQLPVKPRQQVVAHISQPASWAVVESDLQALVREKVVDETSTREAREAIEALRERPQEKWFDHSSIEAGDRLLQAHRQEMSALQARMREASRTLREAAAPRAGMHPANPGEQPPFDELLEEFRAGGLQPDAALMEKLAELSAQHGMNLQQIDPYQLAEMLDQLERNAQRLNEMLDQLQGMPGATDEGEDGQAQNDEGQGEPARGPGEGGPLFGKPEDPLDANKATPLAATDLSRAAPGDVLGVGEAKHNVDTTESPALGSGGSPVQAGDGGGAVWSDTLHPREQEALRRFFE